MGGRMRVLWSQPQLAMNPSCPSSQIARACPGSRAADCHRSNGRHRLGLASLAAVALRGLALTAIYSASVLRAQSGNTAPTISDITTQTIGMNTNTGALAFAVGDAQTPAAGLTLSASSSNTTLVPNANIAFGGSGANRTVTVTPATDQAGASTITVTVSDGSLAASDSFTVVVSSQGKLLFSAPTFTGYEDKNQVIITVQRFVGSYGAVSVNYATSDGTGTAGSDYAATSGTLSWAAGDSQGKTFTIPIYNDSIPEGNETVNLTLSNPTGGATLGIPATAVLTIIEPAPPVLSGMPTTALIYLETEARTLAPGLVVSDVDNATLQSATVTITGWIASEDELRSPSNAITTGSWAVNGTTAVMTFTGNYSKNDYQSVLSSVYYHNTSHTPTTTLRTVSIKVNDGTWDSNIVTRDIIVTPVNDPPGILTGSFPDQAINVNSNTAPILFTIGDAETPLADLILSGNSSNPTLVPTSNIVFGGSGAYRTVVVTPVANQTGTANISVTVSDGSATATSRTFSLTVVPGGTLQFSSAIYLTPTITVTRVGNSTAAVSVNYATSNGTATAGVDYVATSGTLSWASGDTASKTFTVPLISSSFIGNKGLTITLSNQTGGASVGVPSTASLIIGTSPYDYIQFSAAAYTVAEGAGTATITVTRPNPNSTPKSVVYATSNATATAGSDYTGTGGTLSWAVNEGGSKTFTIPILNDSIGEGNETVNLSLSDGPVGPQRTAVLTIVDDDVAPPGTLQFSAAAYTVGESGGTATITVTRTGGNSGAVGVSYATSNGTATAGSDYTATSGTLSWANGDSASKSFTIPITSDTLVEGNETVNVILSSATGGATLGSPATAVLTITDSPLPVSATHAIASGGGGYVAGGTVTITNTLTYTGTATALSWSVVLPAGWTFAGDGGSAGDIKPAAGASELLDWAWTTAPASPVSFTYTLNVPAGETGNKTLAGFITARLSGNSNAYQVLAQPDPLTVGPGATPHSADTRGATAGTAPDFRIDLFELTRVIELFNTRNGTVRTGAYQVDASGEDGFAADPSRTSGSSATLTRYHSADTKGATTGSARNGAFDLFELTRVIELYNTRSGTVRTGQYHVQAGTEDGFSPGP